LSDWDCLADFVVDVANDDAGYQVLHKKADDGVGQVVINMGPVLTNIKMFGITDF
jgi:hypothetical protein